MNGTKHVDFLVLCGVKANMIPEKEHIWIEGDKQEVVTLFSTAIFAAFLYILVRILIEESMSCMWYLIESQTPSALFVVTGCGQWLSAWYLWWYCASCGYFQ